MMIKIISFAFLILFLFTKDASANEINQFVNIVNPVRISSYNPEPGKSIAAEYEIIRRNNLPATWLLTYDAIENKDIYKEVKKMPASQELGIFFEITPKLAKEAGVSFNETGSWHHANSVFLSGYTQEERIRLIDSVFKKFKGRFGYYPASIGSWWTDAYSLAYMAERYAVSANLTLSDQFETDGYQVWGEYWSTPFYPSKYHAGVPAFDTSSKIDVVNLEWAVRDPLYGYKSSLFSTQDYKQAGKDINLFKELVDLYGRSHNNEFGQITVGLEADLEPSGYGGEFNAQIEYVKNLVQSNEFKAVTMKDFGKWYRQKFPKVSPPQTIETDNVIWYQSSKYRVGILRKGDEATIFDLRVYGPIFREPYFESPNREIGLHINIPAIFDSITNENEYWDIDAKPQDFSFGEEGFVINKSVDVPRELAKNTFLNVTKKDGKTILKIKSNQKGESGKIISNFSAEAMHFFKSKKFLIDLLRGIGWGNFKKVEYFVPGDEVFALYKLSFLPFGKVLVYDRECLQCGYHTKLRPPAFSNIRNYVAEIGEKPIIRNQKVFEAKTQREAKSEFDRTKAKYIYLVKFEDYIEKIPFSPGDLGIEKVYENANAQIWSAR